MGPAAARPPGPAKEDIDKLIFGSRPSVADWFRENTGGHATLERAGVLGCYKADKPASRYWDTTAQKDPLDKDGEGWLNGPAEKRAATSRPGRKP